MIDYPLLSQKINPLDAELLLAHILQKSRSWVIAHPEVKLTSTQKEHFLHLVHRRIDNEPLAYLIGSKEFYGRSFVVDKRVLIPRPSTEALIEEVLHVYKTNYFPSSASITQADSQVVIRSEGRGTPPSLIVDIGTGSGCIGITLALELPSVQILCTDVSKDALNVARINANQYNLLDRITFELVHTSTPASNALFSNYNAQPYLIVSNPPYIPEFTALSSDVAKYEPHEALYGGPDGMEMINPLLARAKTDPLCIGSILEMREEQAKKLTP